MLYEKQLLFLCLVDLGMQDKMIVWVIRMQHPVQISVSVCTHTWVDPALGYGTALHPARGDEILNLLPLTLSATQNCLTVTEREKPRAVNPRPGDC